MGGSNTYTFQLDLSAATLTSPSISITAPFTPYSDCPQCATLGVPMTLQAVANDTAGIQSVHFIVNNIDQGPAQYAGNKNRHTLSLDAHRAGQHQLHRADDG